MDASAIDTWPDLRRAVRDDRPGEVVRLYRVEACLTQAQLGALAGYSASTISRIEHGEGPMHEVHTRRHLAAVLRIPEQYLGLASSPARHDTPARPGSQPRPAPADTLHKGRGGDPVQRRTLLGGTVAGAIAGLVTTGPAGAATLETLLLAADQQAPTITIDAATAALNVARRAYADSRYEELTHTLPALLSGLHTTLDEATGSRRETIAGILARAYGLASSVTTKFGDDAIAWVLADRGLGAARQTGDALTTAIATNLVAITMRREGHHQTAVHLLTTTADRLEADHGKPTPDVISAYGRLLCTAAYSSAQAGAGGAADTYITAAARAAERLDGHLVPGEVVPFCPSTVAGYRISVHTALGDSATALHHAATVIPADIPTPERYGRYCVDTARAWQLHGRTDRATHALLAAERHAPGEIARSSVRDLVTTMLYAPTSTPTGLRDLAGRIGATV